MKAQLVIALELAGHAVQEIALGIEPRNLVLVLVGHQLEQPACHRLRQIGAANLRRFRVAEARHSRGITLRIGGVLIRRQELDATPDQLVERLRYAMALRPRARRRGARLDQRAIDRGAAAPTKGALVELDRDRVEVDRAQDRLRRYRHEPPLIGIAEHEQIGRDRVTQEPRRQPGRIEKFGALGAGRAGDRPFEIAGRKRQIRVAREIAGDRLMAVDDGVRPPGAEFRQRFRAGRHDKVAAEQEIGAARREPHRMDLLRRLGNAHMAQHGAALLRQPGHVEDGDALAFEMRRHANERADCHDAGAADPGHQHAVRLGKRRQFRLGQRRQPVFAELAGFALAQRPALDRHKARAEAFEAGVILVAARLIDRTLAAELGLDRHDRQAVRCGRAIAAAFAD